MFPNFQKYIKALDALHLDSNEYLITGSGPLAVHGIRDCADLDILITDRLGESLKQKYSNKFHEYSFCDKLQFNGLDIMWNFREDRPFSTEQQIEEADIVDGKRYQTIERIKFFKRRMNREKDGEDIAAIEAWERLQKNQKSV